MENLFFLSSLEIMSTHVVGTISDSDGAVLTVDEEEGPNLAVEDDWDLPDVVDM